MHTTRMSLLHKKRPQWLIFALFSLISFLISFADAIMSYISPIFIEDQVQSTLAMGIIFSFSSLVGVVCDMIFPKIFSNKSHFFFLKVTVLSSILFPTTFLFFPQHVATLFLAMAIWGVYYELNMFSSFQFIHSYVHIAEHTKAWGVLQAVQSSAYALGPIVAAFVLSRSFDMGFITVFIFLGIALFLTIVFRLAFVPKKHSEVGDATIHKSWLSEFKIWKLLFKRVWPLLSLQFLVTVIDASYWTIGTLLMQSLIEKHFLGGFLLTAYIVPSTLVGLFLTKLTLASGKKRTALITTICAGSLLALYMFINSVPLLIVITGCISFFLGIAVPQMKATFEDYISRLKENGSEMIGIQGSSTSIAFIVGPILATSIATVFGIQEAFSFLGVLMFALAVLLLYVTPRKIRMPQHALDSV